MVGIFITWQTWVTLLAPALLVGGVTAYGLWHLSRPRCQWCYSILRGAPCGCGQRDVRERSREDA